MVTERELSRRRREFARKNVGHYSGEVVRQNGDVGISGVYTVLLQRRAGFWLLWTWGDAAFMC